MPTPGSVTSNDTFTIRRTLDAPRELVWRVYTERDHLMQWFGPKGFPMTQASMDFRPGGIFHYCLIVPGGQEMWGKWVFREIVEPEKLVVVVSFSDADGGITRHPMNPDWPSETLGTTTFEEHDGKTILTVSWEALGSDPVAKRVFAESHDSMRMGWSGTFEQLQAYLEKLGGETAR
jgi:uncharacterized protein YndB with AHSA1/START domain